jgi:hypothetical protein
MGTPTNRFLRSYRATGRGSDYLGQCDVCDKHMAEAYMFTFNRVFKHKDGFEYLSPVSGGVFAHRECGEKPGDIDEQTLMRMGNLRVIPCQQE